jgi:sulfur transfer protein SufE
MSFQKMIASIQDVEDLKSFAESQYKTIVDLSKKLSRLEEEKKSLEKLVENSVKQQSPRDPNDKTFEEVSDEEVIARTQLKLLRDVAIERELTLEETKKAETFTKLLLNIKGIDKKEKNDSLKKLNDEDLLKLLEPDGTTATK